MSTPPRSRGLLRSTKRCGRDFLEATHVGDKVPHLFVHYDAIAARLPGALFIYIVRDISDVACSWNKRAANPADPGWGAESDYRKAVKWWNRGNRETLAFAARGGSVRVVEYEKLWSGDERYLSALFAGLELEDEPGALAAYRQMVATGARYAKLPRLVERGAGRLHQGRGGFRCARSTCRPPRPSPRLASPPPLVAPEARQA